MASELWETFKAEREKAERLGREVGWQEGIEKGLQEGIEKGLQEGIEKGLQEGIEKGLQEGIEKGLQEGIEKGRLEVVLSMLKQERLTLQEAATEAGISCQKLKTYLDKEESD